MGVDHFVNLETKQFVQGEDDYSETRSANLSTDEYKDNYDVNR